MFENQLLTRSFSVPGAGIEPARYCYHRILSPARLPIPPSGHLRGDKVMDFLGNRKKIKKILSELKKVVPLHSRFERRGKIIDNTERLKYKEK